MPLHTHIWDSVDCLLEHERQWDALWAASPVTLVGCRCRPLAHWLRRFQPNAAVRILAVDDGGELVAALPLVEARKRHCFRVGAQPDNQWFAGGTLLLHGRSHSLSELAHSLASRFDDLPWPALSLQAAFPQEAGWRELAAALTARHWFAHLATVEHIACLNVDRFGSETPSTVSRSRERDLRRGWKKLESCGGRLRVITTTDQLEAAEWARRFVDLEDREYGRRPGTSIRQAGLEEFFVEQSRLYAASRHLMIAFLETNDGIAAGQLGWIAKHRYHALKTAFDPRYSRYSPGHVLLWRLGVFFHQWQYVKDIDCLAPIDSPALRGWNPTAYDLGRMWIARPSWLGRSLTLGRKLVQRSAQLGQRQSP